MNIEDYRDFCLSLGDGIEEKFPFTKFKNGEGVLVFYVCGHMLSYFGFILHNGNRMEAIAKFSLIGYSHLDLGIAKYHFEVGAGNNFTWDYQ